MRRWQGIEDSQCVHMHGHGQQRQHQPDLLQPFAQTQYAWIQPQCRKQYWSCTMGSAIARWARVWHFYSLLTTQFAGTPIVGKKSCPTQQLSENYVNCQLKSECTGESSSFGYLWMIDFCSLYDELDARTMMWAGPHSMEYQSGDVLLDALYGVWKQYFEWLEGLLLSPACSSNYFSTYLFQTFWVFYQTITNDTK